MNTSVILEDVSKQLESTASINPNQSESEGSSEKCMGTDEIEDNDSKHSVENSPDTKQSVEHSLDNEKCATENAVPITEISGINKSLDVSSENSSSCYSESKMEVDMTEEKNLVDDENSVKSLDSSALCNSIVDEEEKISDKLTVSNETPTKFHNEINVSSESMDVTATEKSVDISMELSFKSDNIGNNEASVDPPLIFEPKTSSSLVEKDSSTESNVEQNCLDHSIPNSVDISSSKMQEFNDEDSSKQNIENSGLESVSNLQVEEEAVDIGSSESLDENNADFMHVIENNAEDADGMGGLVINNVIGAFGECVDEHSEHKELADISAPYLGDVTLNSDLPHDKTLNLEKHTSVVHGPVILKVKPVRGGEYLTFWDSLKLRSELAEKGSVLLRLCASEPMVGEEFDQVSDYVGVLMDCIEETASLFMTPSKDLSCATSLPSELHDDFSGRIPGLVSLYKYL